MSNEEKCIFYQVMRCAVWFGVKLALRMVTIPMYWKWYDSCRIRCKKKKEKFWHFVDSLMYDGSGAYVCESFFFFFFFESELEFRMIKFCIRVTCHLIMTFKISQMKNRKQEFRLFDFILEHLTHLFIWMNVLFLQCKVYIKFFFLFILQISNVEDYGIELEKQINFIVRSEKWPYFFS